MTSLKMKEKV